MREKHRTSSSCLRWLWSISVTPEKKLTLKITSLLFYIHSTLPALTRWQILERLGAHAGMRDGARRRLCIQYLTPFHPNTWQSLPSHLSSTDQAAIDILWYKFDMA